MWATITLPKLAPKLAQTAATGTAPPPTGSNFLPLGSQS